MDKSIRANPTQKMRQYLQEQKQVSTLTDATLSGQCCYCQYAKTK
jgi:hypothetical protein